MKYLRILMASWDDVVEPIFRDVIERGGHHLTIMSPWRREREFLVEARLGRYDVILLTNLGLPWDFVRGLIAPISKMRRAKVVVMSGAGGEEIRDSVLREGAAGYYPVPMPPGKIVEALEAAAAGSEIDPK